MQRGEGETVVDVTRDLVSLPDASDAGEVLDDLPEGRDWRFEPDWDGLGATARIGPGPVHLVSDRGRDLGRYFPEMVRSLTSGHEDDVIVRGSLIVVNPRGFDYRSLRRRIHPSPVRVATLEAETPSTFVLTDLVVSGRDDMRTLPLAERRLALERLASAMGVPALPANLRRIVPGAPAAITPHTSDRSVATRWLLDRDAVGRDGVVARHEDGRRWVRVRRVRTVACVVTGFRPSMRGGAGSVQLGLYEAERLVEVGRTTTFRRAPVRRAAAAALARVSAEPASPEPGGDWIEVPPALACEVRVERLRGHRFRNAAEFVRWLPDRDPLTCTVGQLEPSSI
ncbi:MAG: ATP-dependent DNA ligase [Actinomycetota bacterium]